MPIYEYDCLECGMRFEIPGSIASGPRDARCPTCASDDVRRHYGSLAVIRHGQRAPVPGELRQADPGRLTADVARRYADNTKDSAMTEVARRVDAGQGPAELKDFVREVKADRQIRDRKGRDQK
jgi:putative FmdB family regulatory protein